METEKKRQLTELQTKFLFFLFGEAEGDPYKAKKLAGYSEATSIKEVCEGVKEEMLDLAKSYLALHGPKAVYKMVAALDNPTPNSNHLKNIDMILNRIGMQEASSGNAVELKVPSGGIFILPAKAARTYEKINLDEVIEDA